jgi:hypothetical protein
MALIVSAGGVQTRVSRLAGILALSSGEAEDPRYGLHNRPPHDALLEIPFTIRVFQEAEGEAPRLVRSVDYSMADIERMMLENPEAVAGGVYGTIGDGDSKRHMGLGGFIDYYEGLRLSWLLFEKAGVPRGEGRAELFDRDGNLYGSVSTLRYFDPPGGDFSAYRVEIDGDYGVLGQEPILAPSKNGAPLLREHEHESGGYIDYNQLNKRLNALGMKTAIGLVKNHSGPFVAALPNLEGVQGGYQVETAADCVRVDIYLREGAPDGGWPPEALQFMENLEAQASPELSRGACAQALAGLCGLSSGREGASAPAFLDVPAEAPYGAGVEWAFEKGLVIGVGGGCFEPERLIRREEVSLILSRMRGE